MQRAVPGQHLTSWLTCWCLQIRDVKDIAGSVKQSIKDLGIDALNLCLLPASGSMDIIRVSLGLQGSYWSHTDQCCKLYLPVGDNVLADCHAGCFINIAF